MVYGRAGASSSSRSDGSPAARSGPSQPRRRPAFIAVGQPRPPSAAARARRQEARRTADAAEWDAAAQRMVQARQTARGRRQAVVQRAAHRQREAQKYRPRPDRRWTPLPRHKWPGFWNQLPGEQRRARQKHARNNQARGRN